MRRFTITQLLMFMTLAGILVGAHLAFRASQTISQIQQLGFTADGAFVVAQFFHSDNYSDRHETLHLLDARTGRVAKVLKLPEDDLDHNNPQPSDLHLRNIVYDWATQSVITRDAASGMRHRESIVRHVGPLPLMTRWHYTFRQLAVSKSGTLVADCDWEKCEITVWNLTTQSNVMQVDLKQSKFITTGVSNRFNAKGQFTDDETHLIVHMAESLGVWRLADSRESSFATPTWVRELVVLPDSLLVAFESKVEHYNLAGVRETFAHNRDNYSLHGISPDGSVAAYRKNGTHRFRVVNTTTNAKVGTFSVSDSYGRTMAFAHDNKRLVIPISNDEMSVFDTESGNLPWTSQPPNFDRWRNMVPLCAFAVWGLVAVSLWITRRRRSKTSVISVGSSEVVE